ncbi:MAG: GNAT family N-acetyltransferase [Candidatus Aminicenantes bacterium]|nr:GNAT family N-acetyltransferase [Candidatus Aminicenantes bacterium]
MQTRRFSEVPRGTLAALLFDAYARSPELTDCFGRSWREFDDFVFDHLAVADDCGFLSLEDGRRVGFLSWDPRGMPESIEIGHNCIVAACQGRGLGREQLARGLEIMRQKRPLKIVVKTGAGDFFSPARRMYEAAGFRRAESSAAEERAIPERVVYELLL